MLTGQSSLLAPFPEPVGGVPATTPSAASQDGRFVAFTASSDGLSTEDDDTVSNVYVKDRQTGSVTFASRGNGSAGEPSHDRCFDASISDDGNRVAFTCDGPLDPADTNTDSDVYVRDLAASRTILISRRTGLGTVANDPSDRGVLSQTGQYVAFESQGNLASSSAGPNIFRREIDGGNATILVSRKTGPGGAAGGGNHPSISDDGNRIAFAADPGSGFYDPADTNGRSDVFVHDEAADTTVLASRKDGATGIVDADGVSTLPVISGNGAFVAFESTADQFDNANDSDTQPDIYRRSLGSNATQLVNISVGGTKGGPAQRPTIDDTGEVVGWVSTTTAFDPADAVVADPDVYLRSGNAVSRARQPRRRERRRALGRRRRRGGQRRWNEGRAAGRLPDHDRRRPAPDVDRRARRRRLAPAHVLRLAPRRRRPRSATRGAAASTSVSARTAASPCSSPSRRRSDSPTTPRTPSSSATSSPTL